MNVDYKWLGVYFIVILYLLLICICLFLLMQGLSTGYLLAMWIKAGGK